MLAGMSCLASASNSDKNPEVKHLSVKIDYFNVIYGNGLGKKTSFDVYTVCSFSSDRFYTLCFGLLIQPESWVI